MHIGYPFHNSRNYRQAAALAAKTGRTVYLNVSDVSIHRGVVSHSSPSGMITDWCAVMPNGKTRKCI